MKIAVNARFLLEGKLEGYGFFVQEVFKIIVKKHPEHQFLFLFDRAFDQQFIFSENVTGLVVSPAARHPLLWKLWYDLKLPMVFRKHKVDAFISCDGFCSLTTRVPQYLIIHDLAFIHYPAFIKRSHLLFYKYFTPHFIKKAKQIGTVSLFSKNDLLSNYKVEDKKIDIVFSAAKEIFQPVSWQVQTETKEKYTGGLEYFLYTGAIHPRKNLVHLLKAFSIFKKRQKANWKLVLAGRLAWHTNDFTKSLSTYKYRKDVVLTGYVGDEELVRLTASAYAIVYPSWFEGFGVPVLEAMKCGIPVITSTNSSMQEIAGDAALYADPADPSAIGEKMMLLYKDESLRSQLIEKGKVQAALFSWERTAGLLWESFMKMKADN